MSQKYCRAVDMCGDRNNVPQYKQAFEQAYDKGDVLAFSMMKASVMSDHFTEWVYQCLNLVHPRFPKFDVCAFKQP